MIKLDFSKSKILIVDDNPANIDILLELLADFDVRAALDGESALEAVKEELPDLILLDITMPGMDGFEVCRRLKANARTKSIPVLFLSASSDADSIIQGFEVGGVDYITKPYLAQEIIVRVQTHLKLQMSLRYLERIANIDELTGISNRRRFFTRSTKLFEQAKAKGVPLTAFVIDIDRFKLINDTYGHAVGDSVVKNFAAYVKKSLPKLNCFARLGGDEFVLVLAGMHADQAKAQVEALRANLEKINLSSDITVTISVGMAVMDDSDSDIDVLLGRADIKLYEAKKSRNALVS